MNLLMCSIGVFGKSCNSFLTMMSSIGIIEKSSTYIIKTAANIALRCSCYIFCCRNKQWTAQSLLQLETILIASEQFFLLREHFELLNM